MRAHRRGQTEMIGLVFVVALIALGIVLYARLGTRSGDGGAAQAEQAQGSASLLVSLLETTVPSCGSSFERVAAACVEGRPMCASGDPCGEAQAVLENVSAIALDARGAKYNLSVEGTGMGIASADCASADPRVDLVAAPRVPLLTATGTRYLRLSLCS